MEGYPFPSVTLHTEGKTPGEAQGFTPRQGIFGTSASDIENQKIAFQSQAGGDTAEIQDRFFPPVNDPETDSCFA